jgi:hypothetical protein|tara:strand:+ start:157 stop:348 length:192 start_codon:yes stop_codon:yes gene_type:complete
MLTIPLIRTEEMNLTPIERSAMRCEQVITAMMMQATIADPTITPQEVDTFTTLSVATITPAEA